MQAGSIESGTSGNGAAKANDSRRRAYGERLARELQEAKRLALEITSALDEGKGFRMAVLDVHEMTLIADYFVIVSGANQRHVKSLADRLTNGPGFVRRPNHVEGYAPGRWILLDYGDVVVHVFQDEERSFYGLERLWGDAPRLEDLGVR